MRSMLVRLGDSVETWSRKSTLKEVLYQLNKDKEPVDRFNGEIECTKLFGLFNWISPEESEEFVGRFIGDFLNTTDTSVAKKYKSIIEDFDGKLGMDTVILCALFELLPQCRRVKEKGFDELGIDKLKEFIVNYPENLFQYHLLECYYLPTSNSYCYASLYHYLRSQQPKKQLPCIVISHVYRLLEAEKKSFYSAERPPEQMLVLLHYLAQLFVYFPVLDRDLLKSLHNLCIEFRLLPKPFGILGDEFVQLLENEYRAPCTGLLYKIREDFPAIDVYISNAKDSRYTEPFEAFLFYGN